MAVWVVVCLCDGFVLFLTLQPINQQNSTTIHHHHHHPSSLCVHCVVILTGIWFALSRNSLTPFVRYPFTSNTPKPRFMSDHLYVCGNPASTANTKEPMRWRTPCWPHSCTTKSGCCAGWWRTRRTIRPRPGMWSAPGVPDAISWFSWAVLRVSLYMWTLILIRFNKSRLFIIRSRFS